MVRDRRDGPVMVARRSLPAEPQSEGEGPERRDHVVAVRGEEVPVRADGQLRPRRPGAPAENFAGAEGGLGIRLVGVRREVEIGKEATRGPLPERGVAVAADVHERRVGRNGHGGPGASERRDLDRMRPCLVVEDEGRAVLGAKPKAAARHRDVAGTGLPVIASRFVGSVGLLGPGYPGYRPMSDAGALAMLLRRDECEPNFLGTLTEACAVRAVPFRPETEAADLTGLITELTAAPAGCGPRRSIPPGA